MLDESNAWQLLSDVYVAKGGEEYLTIGNFKADKELKVIRRTEDMSDKGYGTWSYMYIDDIKVRPVQRKLEGLALALILGGALGNLYDRLTLGYVVDFLDFHWSASHFPAFNIADSGISVGAVLLILDGFINKPDSQATD